MKNFILILVLILISLGLYLNSLGGDFLIDDEAGILNNQAIHSLNIYFSKYFKLRPGVIDELRRVYLWHLWPQNPYPYHLSNIITHAACVGLLFILINLLFNNRALAFITSLIFSLHPIHTEAVSWISGGTYAFSSLFFICAFIFYVKAKRSLYCLALSAIFFTLCFFVGNSAIMLPAMLILYEVFFRPDKDKRLKKIRLMVLSLTLLPALLFVALVFINRNTYIHTIFYFRGLSYLIVITKSLLYYLNILYLPLRRGLYHPFGYNTTQIAKLSPAFFISLCIILGSIWLFFRCRKKAAPISFGLAWFFINYLPYSNIVPVCNIISERYMYLPSAGFCLIMSYLILWAWRLINERKKTLRPLAIIAIALFLGSYAILTLKRNFEYHNILTYWQTNINNFPDGYKAYNNLAGTYYTMGNLKQAQAYCRVNLMINSAQPHVWYNLGNVYWQLGDLKEAQYCYEQALRVDNNFSPAHKALEEIKKVVK